MNVNEGVNLTKMAVGVLLLCLLLSGVLTFWYMLQDAENKQIDAWSKAVESAAADRLFELALQSDTAIANHQYDSYPLVTNVSNALAEFTEDGVVFVSVFDPSEFTTTVYTYEGMSFNSNLFIAGTSVDIKESVTPMTYASTELLKHYNKNRCVVDIIDVKLEGSRYKKAASEDTYIAYSITITY